MSAAVYRTALPMRWHGMVPTVVTRRRVLTLTWSMSATSSAVYARHNSLLASIVPTMSRHFHANDPCIPAFGPDRIEGVSLYPEVLHQSGALELLQRFRSTPEGLAPPSFRAGRNGRRLPAEDRSMSRLIARELIPMNM